MLARALAGLAVLGPAMTAATEMAPGPNASQPLRAPPPPTDPDTGEPVLSMLAAAPVGSRLDRTGWRAVCDSEEPGNECWRVLDGDTGSFWHTRYSGGSPPPPHTITVDMGAALTVNGLSALPRGDNNNHGWIAEHEVLTSLNGNDWGVPAARGTWYADGTEKYANFEPRHARYIRLVAKGEIRGRAWTSLAELNVYRASSEPPPAADAARLGRWSATLDFPIVPVAAAVVPETGRVVVWSAFENDHYEGSPGGWTLTSTWDPVSGAITQRNVSNIGHDMFCPGISFDGRGQLVVTGGSNARKTSMYDAARDAWVAGPDMGTPRGYQSSAALSDGRVFTIGGSWSGGVFEKNGEVLDPATRRWQALPDATVDEMLTADAQGRYRADNHAWLFGWHDGSVFQAGPSTAMNWYSTAGTGDVASAGRRASPRGVDGDSMCGIAVMYDAVAGRILAAGGAPSYQNADATAAAHVIIIGSPGSAAAVAFASNGLWFPRIFHSAVVLPDGTVFISGGQRHGVPFADTTAQMTPELYEPDGDRFVRMAPNSIIRVYHSLSLLLPDATVFNAGGGLCGRCTTNHFDAQIYEPRYLFDAAGGRATRPAIVAVEAATVRAGAVVALVTDGPVASASLVRYGTATHTVNTDQRRVPLALQRDTANRYSARLPADAGVLLPGYWMLFVMNGAGVPSVARTIKVEV